VPWRRVFLLPGDRKMSRPTKKTEFRCAGRELRQAQVRGSRQRFTADERAVYPGGCPAHPLTVADDAVRSSGGWFNAMQRPDGGAERRPFRAPPWKTSRGKAKLVESRRTARRRTSPGRRENTLRYGGFYWISDVTDLNTAAAGLFNFLFACFRPILDESFLILRGSARRPFLPSIRLMAGDLGTILIRSPSGGRRNPLRITSNTVFSTAAPPPSAGPAGFIRRHSGGRLDAVEALLQVSHSPWLLEGLRTAICRRWLLVVWEKK